MLNLPSLRRQDLEQCDHQEKIRAHYDTIATSGLIGAFQYVLDDLSTDFQGRMTRAKPEKFFNDFTLRFDCMKDWVVDAKRQGADLTFGSDSKMKSHFEEAQIDCKNVQKLFTPNLHVSALLHILGRCLKTWDLETDVPLWFFKLVYQIVEHLEHLEKKKRSKEDYSFFMNIMQDWWDCPSIALAREKVI